MKKLFLFLMMAVMLSGVKAQEQVTIGTGTQYSDYMAIPGYFGYHSSAYLYTSDEMPQGGVTISSLSFETQSVSAGSNRALKIWLKEVSDEEIPASIVLNDLLEGATLVYDHTNVPIVANSWNEFLFDSDFLYSGAGNLLVICDGIGCSGSGGCSAYLKYDQTIQNKGWNRGIDMSPLDHTTSQARNNQYRPNVKFTILPVTGDFCAPIANMEVSNIQMNTADITWEGTAVSYTYELKLQNEEWTSENVVIGTADSPFVTLTDLSPMTKYSVRIKAVCADGNESSYMSKNFKTACNDVITSLPYVENFSNGLDCWTIMRESYNSWGDYVGPMIETTSEWQVAKFGSGTEMMAITAPFEEAVENLRVYLEMRSLAYYGTDHITVGLVSDLSDTNTFIPVQTFSSTAAQNWISGFVTFNNLELDEDLTYYMAVKSVGSEYTSVYIRKFEVGLLPECPGPIRNSVEVAPSAETATLYWEDTDPTHDSWIVYYRVKPLNEDEAEDWTTHNASDTVTVLEGLDAETTYQAFVVTDCGTGDITDRTDTIEFITTAMAVELPYMQNFEDPENLGGITFTQLQGTNTWKIGTATACLAEGEDSGSSLYISGDNGVSNTYTGTESKALASIIVDFSEQAEYILEFDLKTKGEKGTSFWDYFQIYALDASLPLANYESGTVVMPKTVNVNNWTHQTVTFPADFIGTVKNVILFWKNDSSTQYNPPAAIDNIVIRATSCMSPTNVAVNERTESTATISWEGTADSYNVTYYKTSNPSEAITENTGDISIELTDLEPATPYTFIVNAVCGDEISSPTTPMSFTTNCGAISDDVWFEDFEAATTSTEAEQIFMCYDVVTSTNQNNGVFPRIYHEGYAPAAHSGSRTLEFKGNGLLALPIFSRPVNTLRFEFYANTTAPDSATAGVMEVGIITDVTDPYTFVPLQQVTPVGFQRSGSFLVGPFDFNTMTETEGRIALRFTPASSNQGESWNLDDFKVMPIPACPSPVANSVVVSEITDTQATVSWTDTDESHNAWTVHYKAENDEDYIVLPATAQTITLTGLTATTAYEVYVMTNCGTGDNVSRTDIVSFRTIATPITEFPYYQTFEDLENNPASFDFRNEHTNKWHIGTATGVVSEAGSDEITTSLYISNDNGVSYAYTTQSATSYANAIMPVIFGEANEYVLSFDYKVNGETYGGSSVYDFLKVFLCDSDVNIPTNGEPTGTGVTTLLDKTAGVTEWTHASLSLTGVANTTKQIVFYWKNDSGSGANPPAAIDNISIIGLSCVTPTNLSASVITSEEVTLAWQENGTATEWTIFYKTAEDTEYTSVVANTNPATISGLIPSTLYSIYVVANCEESLSGQSNTISVVTLCSSVDAFPYLEGFETNPPMCWEAELLSGYNNWGVRSNLNGVTPYEGEKIIGVSFTSGQARLTSPMFDLSSLSNPTIKFAHLQPPYSSSCEEIKVQYKAEPTAEWTDIVTLNTPHSTWELDSIVLPNPSDTYQISFLLIGHYANGAAIDAFELYDCEDCEAPAEPEPCVEPTALTVSNITSSTATVTWEGTADSYEIRLNVGVAESVSTNSYQYTGLIAETSYVVEVRSVCGTETSEWVETFFYTLAEDEEVIAPTVATLAATEVTHESAVLNGTITAGSETITAQGFMYKATAAADWTIVNATGTTISATLTALTAETEYTFKAFATTASGTVEGEAMNFTTTAAPVVIVAPEVVTLAASEITHESAVLHGTITAGSEEITAQGFMYKATAAADWTTIAATGANITATLTALTAETEYTFKAFATTASGTVEGEAMSFTTTAAPVVIVAPEVVTLAASEITNASATLNATVTAGSEEITAQGFMYKATAATDWTTVAATGENMTATVEGLEAEMAYEYKAFATTASGTVEGEVMSFTTLAGLNDAETINAMIYPNPADDKAIISVSVAGAKIVVSDMQGRILLSDDMNESTYELNTANMAAGVYYIRIISGNTVNTQKLIVK